MTTRAQQTLARRLLKAGASTRGVLYELGISQRAVAGVSGVTTAAVSQVLAGPDGVQRNGTETARRVFEAAAALLGLRYQDLPELRALPTPAGREA